MLKAGGMQPDDNEGRLPVAATLLMALKLMPNMPGP